MYERVMKRVIDLVISLLALPFFFILFIFVAPCILIEDGFPIFYNAKRIGKNGKLFKMYKFRSMKNNARDIRLSDGSTYNGEDDPRVTRTGRFLRKTSIDEIPQFLNVLKGEMSLIGPRPNLPTGEYSQLSKVEKIRLKVKPGITGYNQAYYRNSVETRDKYKNDIYYVNNTSFILDLKIFFKTIESVIGRKNINKN